MHGDILIPARPRTVIKMRFGVEKRAVHGDFLGVLAGPIPWAGLMVVYIKTREQTRS